MLFNSLHFALFFLVVTTLYFVLPHRFRWFLLLVASCFFYMAFVPIYILILGFTIVVDYLAGIWIEGSTGRRRKWFLLASICANVGVLACFKYYNFLNDNLTAMLGWAHLSNPVPFLHILLPIGLSFHTFQAMSYTIEVYRGHQRAERHFGIYALYVMFYPQLVAGPIERPQNLLHQFREPHTFDYERITDGLRLMLWGLLKKVIVADRLADVVNEVYQAPGHFSGVAVLLATLFFAYQIYCDFSGYSDIALGAAQVMGFKLMRNFRTPYFASNIQNFWQRWHISLSTWFRDYVYFPLGGSRAAFGRVCFNILVVFAVSGLWHGPDWTYVIWGLLHALYMVVYMIVQRRRAGSERKPGVIGWLLGTLLTLVCVNVAWVFFRAGNLKIAWTCLGKIGHSVVEVADYLTGRSPLQLGLAESNQTLLFLAFLIGVFAGLEYLHDRFDLNTRLKQAPLPGRWAVYYAGLAAVLLLGVFEKCQFIYFQF